MFTALGFWLIRVTIWLSVAAWLARVFLEISSRRFPARDRVIRWTWLIGAIACVAHVVLAMGVGHCWSLANAMRHTSEVTLRVIGAPLPGSVFVNFAFTGLWLIDAAREFRLPSMRSLGPTRHIVWSVMMLNATVVFGPTYWKWIAVPLGVAAFVLFCLRPRFPRSAN